VPTPLRLLRRRPVPFWVAAAAAALLTALLVGRLAGEAGAARDRWGERREVVVATADVAAGEPVEAALRALPVAVVPAGALRSLPRGAVAAVDLAEGEVLLEGRLAGGSILPEGTRGIALPAGGGLPLAVGDRVDVLATFDASVAGDEPTFAVARDAPVVHVGDDAVTVAVSESEAPRVAYALTAGSVTVVLSGTSSRR
jgi:Flp pilus assembly protein CpaB